MSATARIVAIIPARGGSRSIPHKNILMLAGRPLIAYTIEAARSSSAVDRVIVSTDSEPIAAVSRAEGAEVIVRPAEIAGDEATSESALVHALDVLRRDEGYVPEVVVFLQATSPIRSPGDIDNALDEFFRRQADSLFSAYPHHGFVWQRTADGLSSIDYDFNARPRRQDIAPRYVENGSIYVFRPAVLAQSGNRLGGKVAVYVMSALSSLQIDEQEDVAAIEELLRARNARD